MTDAEFRSQLLEMSVPNRRGPGCHDDRTGKPAPCGRHDDAQPDLFSGSHEGGGEAPQASVEPDLFSAATTENPMVSPAGEKLVDGGRPQSEYEKALDAWAAGVAKEKAAWEQEVAEIEESNRQLKAEWEAEHQAWKARDKQFEDMADAVGGVDGASDFLSVVQEVFGSHAIPNTPFPFVADWMNGAGKTFEQAAAEAAKFPDDLRTLWDKAYGENSNLAALLKEAGVSENAIAKFQQAAQREFSPVAKAVAKWQSQLEKLKVFVEGKLNPHQEGEPAEFDEPEPEEPDDAELDSDEYKSWEEAHDAWERREQAAQERLEDWEKKGERLEAAANKLEESVGDLATAVDDALSDADDAVTDHFSAMIDGEIEKIEAARDENGDEPDEPDYDEIPDEPDYPDEPDPDDFAEDEPEEEEEDDDDPEIEVGEEGD